MLKYKVVTCCFLILLSSASCAQNKHLTLGLNDSGLCLGNSENHSGVRLNLIDKDVNQLNGINIACVSKATTTNGLTIGLISNMDATSNGILINGLAGETLTSNGIAISGIGHVSNNFNGIGIGGLGIAGENLNGLFISLLGVMYWNTEKIDVINGMAVGLIFGSVTKKMNGVSLSVFNNVCDTLNGVAIGAINKTQELYGVQFGIWNEAENKRYFKRLPIVNFNFRRKTRR